MPRRALIRSAAFIGLVSLATWLVAGCGGTSSLVEATPTSLPATPTSLPATPISLPATPTPEPTLTPSPEPEAKQVSDPETSGIELRMVIAKLSAGNDVSELQEGDKLASCVDPEGVGCDVYALYFEPAQEAYIYAFQQDSTGDVFVLFPNSEYNQQSNPVPPGTRLWVPKDFGVWFPLDENTGQEKIFVVAGLQRVDLLEGLVQSLTSDGSPNIEAKIQLLNWLRDTRGPKDPVKRIMPVTLPEGEQKDLKSLILEARGEAAFVYEVSFQHIGPARLR